MYHDPTNNNFIFTCKILHIQYHKQRKRKKSASDEDSDSDEDSKPLVSV